jgi:hypothetical protein
MIDIDVLFSDGRTWLARFKFLIVVLLYTYSFLGYTMLLGVVPDISKDHGAIILQVRQLVGLLS